MYCQNCGKPISNVDKECQYCKTKVYENNNQYNFQEENQKNNNSGLNKILYNGMNGKPVPVWKFILGLLLLVGGIFIAISAVL